ncbi:hypothetical protein BC835DRAFT_1347863 [Cytidiella melzeri]|nr:hypothetical protein BC835DRAFT_1347863 [Cytidiella melzeri]
MRIHGRTPLLRELWSAGARTVTTPPEAHIILVQPETQEAEELLQSFPNILVLDVAWARAALRSGAFASQDEEWGGYQLHSDLPNHRATPHPQQMHSPAPAPVNDVQMDQQNPATPVIDQNLLATLSQALRALPASSLPVNINLPNQTFQLLSSAISPHASQPGIPAGAGQVPMTPQDLVNLLGQLLSPPAQDSNLSQNHFQAHQWPSHGLSSAAVSGSFPNHQPSSSSYMPASSIANNDLANIILNAHQVASHPASSWMLKGKSRRDSSSSSPMPRGSSVDMGSRSPYEDEVMSHSSPPPQPQKTKHNGRSRHLFTNDDGKPLLFYVQPSIKRRHESVDMIKRYGGVITAQVAGSDYVVLATQSDHFHEALCSAVASDVPAVKVDFVVECVRANSVLDSGDYSFEGEVIKRKRGPPLRINLAQLHKANRGEKKARKARGSRALDDEALSKEEDHLEDATPATPAERMEQPLSAGKKRPNKPYTHTLEEPTVKKTEPKDGSPTLFTANHDAPRSPSPIAPDTVVEIQGTGKYLFTPEEREYWPKYVEHALKYNPGCPISKLAQGLSKKMPHHPASSWNTAILGRHKHVVEDTRKKAYIEARKNAGFAQKSADSDSQPMESPRIKLPLPRKQASTPPMSPGHALEQDLETVTKFLVDGGAEGTDDDSAVWDILQKQHPCHTQPNWEVFWEEHGETVTQRVTDIARRESVADIKMETDA